MKCINNKATTSETKQHPLYYNINNAIIEHLSGSIPVYDFICNQNLNFIKKCLSSSNILVNSVVCHGVFFSRMQSGVGRNVQLCSERYRAVPNTVILLFSRIPNI